MLYPEQVTRLPLIAANWKMNPPPAGFRSADSAYVPRKDVDVVVFPTFLDLAECIGAALQTGAQCAHPEEKGPHTGDIGMAMIKNLGCTHVLCGHSERRKHCGDTDERVAEQVHSALNHGLHPVLCIGETKEERDAGEAMEAVQRQLQAVLSHLSSAPAAAKHEDFTIAYEPVWAIGKGATATVGDIAEMHEFIRSLLPVTLREKIRIIYGGSLNAKNAGEILSIPDVDGGLVGGASLRPDEFQKIVEIAQK